ncbi:hypothetical protein CSW59_16320 [Caulobacter sp. BP25]|nr:hypothetical protein CSW59_16320 [Caulobacter sp. BP25]
MDKLKATVSYKQFDAPPASEQAWPVLEKMARAKSALSEPVSQVAAASAGDQIAPAAPVAAPVAAPASAPARMADVLVTEAPAEGSLFERLQADAAPAKSAAFGRYGAAQTARAAKTAEAEPQALSEIFERIGRKAL